MGALFHQVRTSAGFQLRQKKSGLLQKRLNQIAPAGLLGLLLSASDDDF